MESSKSSLIILDINGLLVLRLDKRIKRRKGLTEFLAQVFEIADVAIYSSMTKKNLDATLSKIFSPDQLDRIVFIWGREYTKRDPEIGVNKELKNWATIKTLERIKNKFKYEKYLIIDDSPDKLRFVNPDEVLICPTFDPKEDSDILKELTERIKLRLKNNFI